MGTSANARPEVANATEQSLDEIASEMGVKFEIESVNGEGVPTNGVAVIPIVSDISKFDSAHPGKVLAALDQSGFRIPAQDVCRGIHRSNAKRKPQDRLNRAELIEAMKEGTLERITEGRSGKRTRVVTVEVEKLVTTVIHSLPGGQYTGDDEMEWRQLYMAALVEQGVAADTARTVVLSLSW